MTLLTQNSSSSAPRESIRTVGQRFQSVILMVFVSLLFLGGIGSRLAYLQLVEGDHNRQLADNNRIRLMPRQPERGRILDRKGRTLAGSRLSYAVFLWPIANDEEEWEPIIIRLSEILKQPPDSIRSRLQQVGYYSPTLIRVARGISPAQVTALAELNQGLNGVQVEGEAVRYYPNGDLAAHVLGYTGELTDEELEEKLDEGYRLGDVVGQMGVEAAFESQLRGEWGGQQVEVDGMGQVIQVLGEKSARAGDTVTLTLDLDVQKAAEAALGDRKGAIVAIDPRTGGILAMVSRPTFDPNIFSGRISDEQWQDLQGKEFPFVNRALQGFPPASTFKIVTTTAAIESGSYALNTVLPTYPYITAGGIQFWDWNRAGFGPLDFRGAMAMSSDTFFYQTAIRMGGEALIEWTRRYGFGRKTGVELATEEARGLVPDEAWKQENIAEGWYVGDSINMSIGQGYLQATPLQVALMFGVPATGGSLLKPHLLKDNEEAQAWRESLNISPSTIRVLQEGLRQVMTRGTARSHSVPSIPAYAGKTGTAEDPPRLSHAWFGAYAPYENPEIIVVSFAENSGGGGGAVAAPMVRQVLEAYFRTNGATPPTPTPAN